MKHLFLVLLLAVSFLAASCGSDDSDSSTAAAPNFTLTGSDT